MTNGRPKIYDEHEVIEKAQQVFWEKGYAATSTEELLAAMGIGRGSFYLAFGGGKKELFERSVKQFHRDSFTQFEKQVGESKDPLEVVKEFFRSIARAKFDTHLKGCYIGNTIVEMAAADDHMEKAAIRILKEVEGLFARVIAAAQANGTIKNKADAKVIARHLITLWNGLNITRRMYPDNTVLKQLIDMQLEILN